MKKLTKLTEQQKAAIPAHVEKWIAKGLSTEPADFEIFERAVKKCYKFAGLDIDIPIIRVKNPFIGAFTASIAREIIKKYKNNSSVDSSVDSSVRSVVDSAVGSAVDSSVDSSVDSAVDSAVRSAVGSSVYSEIDSSVRSAVGSSVDLAVYSAVDSAVISAVDSAVDSAVGLAVDSSVGSSVDSAVRSAVRSAVGSEVRSAVDLAFGSAVIKNISWHEWFGGKLWTAWQAYLDYYLSICKLELSDNIMDRIKCYRDAQMSAGYWWPNKNFIIVCDTPDTINLDDNGRLHSDDGMAIRWRDGVGLYFSHGQKIPGWIITSPEKITVENIQSEKNVEIKRVMIEKYGVSRYLVDIKAKIVDMDSLTLVGSAPRALIKDHAGNQWLIGTDGSTARVYHMAVDTSIKTCKEAHEQLCGFSEDRLLVEC